MHTKMQSSTHRRVPHWPVPRWTQQPLDSAASLQCAQQSRVPGLPNARACCRSSAVPRWSQALRAGQSSTPAPDRCRSPAHALSATNTRQQQCSLCTATASCSQSSVFLCFEVLFFFTNTQSHNFPSLCFLLFFLPSFFSTERTTCCVLVLVVLCFLNNTRETEVFFFFKKQ